MTAMFLRVDPKHAGPNALGVLVPQGATTLVILRPRALPWDLLPARWDGDRGQAPQFCVFTRDEAASAARRLMEALQAGVNPLESFGDEHGEHVQIWLRTAEFVWIVCRRAQGQAYQPMIFASPEDAEAAAAHIAAYVRPTADARQEYYFNTQNFS